MQTLPPHCVFTVCKECITMHVRISDEVTRTYWVGRGEYSHLGQHSQERWKMDIFRGFHGGVFTRVQSGQNWVTGNIPHVHRATCVTATHWCINPSHWTHMECSIPGAQMCVAPGAQHGKSTVHIAVSWSYLIAYSSQKTQDHWWGVKDMTCADKKNKISTACHIHS
jgi:hypothetical protein